MAARCVTLELEARVEELLEHQGFEDADDWGPNGKGYVRWADEVQRDEYRSALSNLVEFLEELCSVGLRYEAARRVIGNGERSVETMRELLDVRNKLVAAGADADRIDNIVTSRTTIHAARKQLKALLNPPSALEEQHRPPKRERQQVENFAATDSTAEVSGRQPVSGQVWGQSGGAGRVVAIVSADCRRVHTVRLYRHWELVTYPYNIAHGQHQLVSSDRRQATSTSAFLMTHQLLGRCDTACTNGSDSMHVSVCGSYVYHERFPVSFRSRPAANDVLGLRELQEVCVCCESRAQLNSLRGHSMTAALPPNIIDPLISQQDSCSQDARGVAESSSDDEERVVHSQCGSIMLSDEEHDDDVLDDNDVAEAEVGAAPEDAPEDDDEGQGQGQDQKEEDLSMEADDAATPRTVHKQMQAIELYAGCGGLAHLAGCSHGVALTVAWAVECMPEAAATYRANHPCTKVLEITTATLLEHIHYWMAAREAWLNSPTSKRKHVQVRNCQIMQKQTAKARDDENDGTSDDDFEDSRPWTVSKILDFQAVTRRHKPDPLAKGASKQIWMEYRCRLQRGSEHTDGWVEFAKRDTESCGLGAASSRGDPSLFLLMGEFVNDMIVARRMPLPECVDVVCGGPPCQGVSGHNMYRTQVKIDADGIKEGHRNNQQLDVFLDYIKTLRPRFSVLENVVDILLWPTPQKSLGKYVLQRLLSFGYQCSAQVLFAGAFGLCTSRPRTILLGAVGEETLPVTPRPTHHSPTHHFRTKLPAAVSRLVQRPAERGVRKGAPYHDGLGDLKPALTLGDVIGDRKRFPAFSSEERENGDDTANQEWADRFDTGWCKEDARYHGGVMNHQSYVLNVDDSVRVKLVPEGGNWQDIQRLVENGQVSEFLPSGKPLVSKYMRANKKGNPDLPFKRLRFSEGMRTVICRIVPHTQQSIHPSDDRVLSVREMMCIQGFDIDYVVRGSLEKQYKQAGNVVPPPLAQALGHSLRRAAARGISD